MYVDAVRAFEEYTRPRPVKIMRNALRRRRQENDADDEITEEEEEGGKQARDDSVLGGSDADVVAAEAVATYVCYRRVHVALIQSTQRVFEANNSNCGTESRMGQRVKWQFISLVEGALDVVRSLAGDTAEQEAYLSLKNDDALSGLSFPPVQVETACSASLFCMLAAAIKLVDESENPEEYDKLEGRLMRLCCGCLRSYLEQSTHPVEETVSLVLTILRGVRSDFPGATFAKYIHHIFPLLSGRRHETCSRVSRTEPITLTCVVIPDLHLPPLVRGRQHTRTHTRTHILATLTPSSPCPSPSFPRRYAVLDRRFDIRREGHPRDAPPHRRKPEGKGRTAVTRVERLSLMMGNYCEARENMN